MATDEIRSLLQEREEAVEAYCEALQRLRQLCAKPLLPIHNEASIDSIRRATTKITDARLTITETLLMMTLGRRSSCAS